MTELTDYQKQVAKLKRYQMRVTLFTAGFIIVLFAGCVAYAVWATSQTRDQTTEIVNYINGQTDVGSQEALVSRQGGDIIRCILNIPATTRTQADIDNCYPGGSNEAWLKLRDEALSND